MSSNLSELYRSCRTFRRFKQDPVPEEVIHQILENCRVMSCTKNGQQLKFYAVVSPEKVKKMGSLVKFAGLLPRNLADPKENELPVAYIVVVKTNPKDPWLDVDCGIAADTICMTAWEAGFGSCILGAIDVRTIHDMLGLAPEESVRIAIALGKPDHTSTIVDVPENGSLAYYVDEDVNYYVPKKAFDEVNFIV